MQTMQPIKRAWTAVAVAVAIAGCGGGRKPTAVSRASEGPVGDEEMTGGDVVPPERMDEIKSLLDRKRTAAARCLADAVNSGKVPKNVRGHVALGFVINRGGQATGVKVLESSIDNPDLESCVIEKVKTIDFGPLPEPLDWSYTYAFESM